MFFQDYIPYIKMLTSLKFYNTYLPEALNFLFVLPEVHKTYLPKVHKTVFHKIYLPKALFTITFSHPEANTVTLSLPEAIKNPPPWEILFLVQHLPEVWVNISSLRNF